MAHAQTRYAWSGDVALAYQVVGDGPSDVVYLQGWASNVDLNWASPHLAGFLEGLAKRRRLIVTDRRGWGCSDRFSPADVPPIETLTEDLGVVMDATGVTACVLVATQECAIIAELFAAMFPERVRALVLCDPWFAYEIVNPNDLIDGIRETYPRPEWWEGPPGPEREWYFDLIRSAAAPGALIAELRRFLGTDLRTIFPAIQAPTLVMGDADAPAGDVDSPDLVRALGAAIPGARCVMHHSDRRPSWDHWYTRADPILREIDGFLASLGEEGALFDRALATVLFTDIVGSTERAASLGDREWHHLLDRHHAVVRSMLGRYRGREVDTAGDGFFATFDGPARAIRCASAIAEAVRPLDLEIRAGLHTGEVELTEETVRGLAVHIGARVGALAGPSEVLVSSTVKDLVAGSGLAFEDAGDHELKGVPDRWRLYRVVA